MMKHLATALWLSILAITSPAIAGQPTVDVPMQPSETLKTQLPEVGSLVGIYLASNAGVAADMKKLQADDFALDSQLVALVAETKFGQFHVSNAGLNISLEETQLVASRKGRPLNLEDACRDWPKAGDRLLGTYRRAGWTAKLDVSVESHVPYVKEHGQLKQARAGDVATCASEVGAQTYYSGMVTVTFDGKVIKRGSVVAYNLQLP